MMGGNASGGLCYHYMHCFVRDVKAMVMILVSCVKGFISADSYLRYTDINS